MNGQVLQEFWVEGKINKTTIKVAMLYGFERWTIKKHTDRQSVTKTRMLRWMSDKIRIDRIRNEKI